jgi:hypothetical protein
MAVLEEDTFVNDDHPSHYKGEIDLFISARDNKMTARDATKKDERRSFFSRSSSQSSTFRKKSQSRSGVSALTRQGSNRNNSSKQYLQKQPRSHSFSHNRHSRDMPTVAPDSPRLMTCFDIPPPKTMLGSKNSENWTSFHSRYSESSKRPRRQRSKTSREDQNEVKSQHRQRKKRGCLCLWSALSCFRPKDGYHSDDENCEWTDERVWSLGTKYVRSRLAEAERRQLQLMS